MDYLNNLINQKLILQDAQRQNLDKKTDFLKSIERFWEQSLLTVALSNKVREITGTINVDDQSIQQLYDSMLAEGKTTESFQQLYPQLKSQVSKNKESEALSHWVDSLRQQAKIHVNEDLNSIDQ
jgi:hypothetical protein